MVRRLSARNPLGSELEHAPDAWKTEDWIGSTRRRSGQLLWRAVEAQHRVATMSLVGNLQEQEVLEQLLEKSKPPLLMGSQGQDYLLSTPFRYTSPYASRFRRGNEPGVWYGAVEVETACAEVGHWRWRFHMDSEGLRGKELRAELTLFQARVRGRSVDLTAPPWANLSPRWSLPRDYTPCHELADAARAAGLDWIRYPSARYPYGHCGAVFTPTSLDQPNPERTQTWLCRVSEKEIHFVHEQTWLKFEPDAEAVLLKT